MAGLCEGGNEPPDSLKAILRKNSPQYVFRNSSHSCHYRRHRTYRFDLMNIRVVSHTLCGGGRQRQTTVSHAGVSRALARTRLSSCITVDIVKSKTYILKNDLGLLMEYCICLEFIYTTHATRALQGRDLSGEELIYWITYIHF
ncbi:hypothetical protein ANN_06086 [Periplaneta americana]|uniref:Uncharacterized protein n=1 Tax=Periplaneta americana TaxID=6978 RepID=A0ABQ8TCN1_PERAM|nr:hypothetical protein ANN_06086 [Periplaneta americana]